MATIQIDDTAARLTRTRSSNVDKGETVVDGGRSREMNGIYNMRHRSVSRSSGLERHNTIGRNRSAERSGFDGSGDDEDSGLRHAGDFKQRQVFKGKLLLWLAYQSIGVIYGDIGTSPLYVFSSTFTEEPSHEDLVGVLSIIIWSLTMMVTLKYVIIILHADNEGEGGTFSCYSLLSRYANITNRDPRELSLVKMERYLTLDLKKGNRRIRSTIEKSTFLRGLLKTMGVLAVSMVMSDGVLTPAQSVLGAVQGLRVVKEDITDSTVIGTTCGILILLFLIQPLGTSKIASAFAPIVIIWLGFNAAFGIYNLVLYDDTVLKAFSPSFAFSFLIRNKTHGWRQLGGVLLAFTGVEALFADLGAFSMRAIQLSWLCYTYPCLLLAYIGQAAYISKNTGAYSNPFFNAVPPGTLYPSIVIAVLAAIVASQAIITATFQLLTQIMKLSYFPQIKVVHTSKIFHGQVYVPLLNWLLMIGTILAAAIYKNTTSLGNAYGVCVMFVTFFDTCFVSLTALVVWRASPLLVFFPWLTIACLDGLYLSAALIKVPDGAWFTLTLSGILACLFILWRYGKENQWKAEAADRFPTSHLVQKREDGTLELTERYGGFSVSKIKGFGIFFDKSGETTPAVFSDFLSKLIAAPEVIVFFHLRPLETPSVPAENRYIVSRLGIPNCYRLVVRHGYMDEVITPDLASLVCKQVRDFLVCQGNGIASSRDLYVENGEVGILHQLNTNTSHTQQQEEGVLSGLSVEEISDSTFSETKTTEKEKDITDEKRIGSIRNRHASVIYTKEAMLKDLRKLEEAFDHQVLYIIGKVQLKVKPGTNWGRLTLLRAFMWMRENTRTKIANLRVRADKVIEIGFIKEV